MVKLLRHASVYAALIVFIGSPSADAADDAGLDTLLHKFEAMPGLEGRFHEEKHLALLAAPLITDGVLDFAAPGELARRTTSPTKTVLVINGTAISFHDGHTGESLSLESNPVARLFVDSFVKIFSGDRRALEKLYDMQYTPGPDQTWSLHLKPKVDPMDKVISAIDIDGDGVVIRRMRVVESDGDETVTTFSSVNPQKHFTPAERASIFATAAP